MQSKILQTEIVNNTFNATNDFRKKFKYQREPIIEKRYRIKAGIQEVKDNEKKLKEIINTNANDLPYSVQLYKEVINSGVALNYNLTEKALDVISLRKEEGYLVDLKKMTVKNKNDIIKIIEDIKLNGWRISKAVMDRFYDLSK